MIMTNLVTTPGAGYKSSPMSDQPRWRTLNSCQMAPNLGCAVCDGGVIAP